MNPFDLLGEVELNAGDNDDLFSNTEVFAEVRFDEDELEVEGSYEISVSLTKCYLELELWGCEIVPGSRLNDRPKEAIHHETKIRRQATARAAVSAKANTSKSGASGHFAAEGALVGEHSDEHLSSSSWETNCVVAKSGKRWLLQEPSAAAPLSGTYIANERLCEITPNEHTNNVEVLARLTTRKRDIIVEPQGTSIEAAYRKIKHQQKFIAAIIAKSLSEASSDSEKDVENGKIVIGKSRLFGGSA